jgi:hypothetical protein
MRPNVRHQPLNAPWHLLCPVDYSYNIYLIFANTVDNAIWTLNYLTHMGKIAFRNHPTGVRKLTDLLRAPRQTINHA